MAGRAIIKEKLISLHGLEILVQYKLVKNITLRVCADNQIKLSVPYIITDRELHSFLAEKEAWLRSKLELRRQRPEKRYLMGEVPFDGEHIWLWGEKIACCFEVEKKAKINFRLTPNCLRFIAPRELTEEQKLLLRRPGEEYTLLVNGGGEYELTRWEQTACGDDRIRAFIFERNGAFWAAYWHLTGEGRLWLPLEPGDVRVSDEPDGDALAAEKTADGVTVPAGGRRYLRSGVSREELAAALASARIV